MLRKDNESIANNKMNGKNAKVSLTSETIPEPNRTVPKRKQHKKLVRLLTVAAYVFFVSLGAIVLSLYYVFLWDPQMDKVTKKFTATEVSTPSTIQEQPAMVTMTSSAAPYSDVLEMTPSPGPVTVSSSLLPVFNGSSAFQLQN